MKLIVGISYAPQENAKTVNYVRALHRAAEQQGIELETIDLYTHQSEIENVDAILFTGGSDIAPERYGKQSELSLCGEIDEQRDRIEFELADRAEERELPTLGICRGAQLLNVRRGGTLVTDLQHFGGIDHKKVDAETDNRHHVKVTPGTSIKRILRQSEGEVNSAHHQAVERLGEGLIASARAEEDGTIEAIELADPKGHPFFLAVQWHPERMNYDENFSHLIFESFIAEAAAHKMLRSRMGSLKDSRERAERRQESADHQ